MKLLWFHRMPYTDLPDDLRQKHSSVWVDIDSRLFDPRKACVLYNEFMDELEHAAEMGFHGICVNEHHSNAYGLVPSPNLIATRSSGGAADPAIGFEAIVDQGYVIVGSSDEVAEKLRTVATKLDVGHLMLLLLVGAEEPPAHPAQHRAFASGSPRSAPLR